MNEFAWELGFGIAYGPELLVGNQSREGEPWWTRHDISRVLPQAGRLRVIRWIEIFEMLELQLDGSVLVFIPCNKLRRKIVDRLEELATPPSP